MTVNEARRVVREYLTELERVIQIPHDDREAGDWVLLSERLGIAEATLLLAVSEERIEAA